MGRPELGSAVQGLEQENVLLCAEMSPNVPLLKGCAAAMSLLGIVQELGLLSSCLPLSCLHTSRGQERPHPEVSASKTSALSEPVTSTEMAQLKEKEKIFSMGPALVSQGVTPLMGHSLAYPPYSNRVLTLAPTQLVVGSVAQEK